MTATFADPASPSRALHVVSCDDLQHWLSRQSQQWQAWLAGQNFAAALGETRLLPGPDGEIAAAVTGFGTAKSRARTRFGLAGALQSLPAGNWHFEGPSPAR